MGNIFDASLKPHTWLVCIIMSLILGSFTDFSSIFLKVTVTEDINPDDAFILEKVDRL